MPHHILQGGLADKPIRQLIFLIARHDFHKVWKILFRMQWRRKMRCRGKLGLPGFKTIIVQMKRKEILEIMDGESKIRDSAGLRIIIIHTPFIVPNIEIVIYPQQEGIAFIDSELRLIRLLNLAESSTSHAFILQCERIDAFRSIDEIQRTEPTIRERKRFEELIQMPSSCTPKPLRK